jgi:sec-independent protein translocase protein TatA
MPMLGPWELIIILVIVVVVFGAGRLSEVGGAVGKSIKEFRKATDDGQARGSAAQPAAAQPVVVSTVPAPAAPANSTVPAAAVTTAPVATAVVENKCPSCATINPPTQAFCGQCGTRLTRDA